eukprot:290724-Amphidinium_carterae.3
MSTTSDRSKKAKGSSSVVSIGGKAKPRSKPTSAVPAKRLKIEFGGDRVCALCKKSSEDTCCGGTLLHRETRILLALQLRCFGRSKICPYMLQVYGRDGTPWALYAQGQDGARVPQNSACQDCWELWERAFVYYDWSELCSKHHESKEVASMVAKARAVKHGQGTADCKPEAVRKSEKIMLQVERTMTVLSEKELRKVTKSARISKIALKNLPCFTVAAWNGDGIELVYGFQDMSSPHRKAKLIVQSETSLSSTLMARRVCTTRNKEEDSMPTTLQNSW